MKLIFQIAIGVMLGYVGTIFANLWLRRLALWLTTMVQ
jgi:hypothetical protein